MFLKSYTFEFQVAAPANIILEKGPRMSRVLPRSFAPRLTRRRKGSAMDGDHPTLPTTEAKPPKTGGGGGGGGVWQSWSSCLYSSLLLPHKEAAKFRVGLWATRVKSW